jgi:hypothetical protein
VSAGVAGLAACHAYAARALARPIEADRARVHLDQAIHVLATQPLTSSLYAGFPGIAWAAQLVDQLLGDDGEDRNEEIDDVVVRVLRRYPGEAAPYDLIHGLGGLGVYALSRWPSAMAAGSLVRVVELLHGRARHDADGVYWWTSPGLLLPPRREVHPEGGVDLGVAHGIAGLLPLLARVQALGLARPTVDSLLDGAVRWLFAHTVDTPSGPTVPYFLAPGDVPQPARSAWCYGDPGVAAVLLLAADDAHRPEWRSAAVELAQHAAQRPLEETGVTDAGLCHGSAGLAHLYARMYALTGDDYLRAAAVRWVEHTLAQVTPVLSPPSTAQRVPEHPLPWNGPGLLEGAAGVTVALLAAATDAEPVWDSLFLVSTTAPAAAPTAAATS